MHLSLHRNIFHFVLSSTFHSMLSSLVFVCGISSCPSSLHDIQRQLITFLSVTRTLSHTLSHTLTRSCYHKHSRSHSLQNIAIVNLFFHLAFHYLSILLFHSAAMLVFGRKVVSSNWLVTCHEIKTRFWGDGISLSTTEQTCPGRRIQMLWRATSKKPIDHYYLFSHLDIQWGKKRRLISLSRKGF